MKEKAFKLFAFFFIVTAAYHLAGLFYPINESPKWRHALFIGLNLFCAYGMLERPKWFVYFFFVLMIQQLNSHGSSMVNRWIATNSYSNSWIDLSVVIITPLIFLMLALERINSKQ